MNRLATLTIGLTLALAAALAGCAGSQAIETLNPGVLKVAVTTGAPTSEYDPQLWIRRYVQRFADEHDLTIEWLVVPFNESWLRAGGDEVDLVATNVANFADRVSDGGTFSERLSFTNDAHCAFIPKTTVATNTSPTLLAKPLAS